MDSSFLGTYHVGDTKTIAVEFTVDETPTDPTGGARLVIREPDGTLTTLTDATIPAITNPADGNYEANVNLDQHGRWDFRWVPIGSVDEVDETWLLVERSRVLIP